MKTKISIVIPIYNREQFLGETIQSILDQDYGFENMELILVDDGSKDRSVEICQKFKSQYPDQIKVIEKANGGASSARNEGLRHVTGEWVNFLDSDDKLEKDAVRKVARFIKKHENEVDVIALPIFFFGDREGAHGLNYKFDEGTRVIDLTKEWENPQLSLASSFVRVDTARKYSFKKDLHIASGEDAWEVLGCLMEKQTLGVVSNTKYYYRKHEGESLLGASSQKVNYYIDNLVLFHFEVIKRYKECFNSIPLFVQNILMYDLQWRLKQKRVPNEIENQIDIEKYKSLLFEILSEIENVVIVRQRNIWGELKSFALYKNGNSMPCPKQNDVGEISFEYPKTEGHFLRLPPPRFIYIDQKEKFITIWGWMPYCVFLSEKKQDLSIYVNGIAVNLVWDNVESAGDFLGEIHTEKHFFHFDFKLEKKTTINVEYNLGTLNENCGKVRMPHSFPLNENCRFAYAKKGNLLLRRTYGGDLLISASKGRKPIREMMYRFNLMIDPHSGTTRAVVVRILLDFYRIRYKNKRIWLISDRFHKADDNGEVLFKYLVNHASPDISLFFLLEKKSSDYSRLSQIGEVIEPYSLKHRMLYLLSEYFISSQADQMYLIPFKGHKAAYKDLIQTKFIFLQHGVTKDNISRWLNKHSKNIFGFISSSKRETKAFLEPDYFYELDDIWEVGMCRFDERIDKKEKLIVVAPTWRQYLSGMIKQNGNRQLDDYFFNSGYIKFYRELLLDKKIEEYAKQYGYKILFYPHPNLLDMIDGFGVQSEVAYVDSSLSYGELYAKAALFVTDYSSVVFDFAYMYKPVLYAQFDKDEFFSGSHTYTKGYFDYERDGFGEVTYDLDSTVDMIIEYMQNDCQMKDKYRKRVDEFFTYHDHNNCQRTYEKLLECSSKK